MSLGLDIGKHSVKIVELATNNGQVEVKNFGIKPIFEDMNKFNLDKISKSQIEATIQDLINELGINPKRIKKLTSSISGTLVDIREISTLDMPDDELAVSLELEAKKHIPLDGTDAIIDYHHLGVNNKEIDKINILLASTTKNIIKEHADIIKKSGFKPNIFDSDPIAIANTYNYNNELPKEGADVILNIGNSATTLIVWGENCPFFTRTIDLSGNFFTNEIMREFKVDYKTGEDMKFEKGIDVFSDNKEATDESSENIGISIEKRTPFNEFSEDIKRTLRFYIKNNSQAFFNKFYITGGSAMLPGLKSFIASTLNVEVEILNPLKNINNNTSIENINQFTTAIGLAIRGLDLE